MLPEAHTEDAYDEICDDEDALRPGVAGLLRRLGVDPGDLTRYPTGSLPVYAAGDRVLKLFPQVHRDEYPVEAGVLAAVEGALPIPTPPLYAAGEHDGWGYVLMGRLTGTPLTDVWPRLDRQGRDRLADQLGLALGVLHSLTLPDITPWWPADWADFVATQRANCAARQRALGLAPALVASIPDALAALRPPTREPVLLHTEVLAEHLLVTPDERGWRLTGLFDFEPAMRGDPEYEFVSLGVFVARGDGRFLGRTLRAYGYTDTELTPMLSDRLLAWALLHYYSNVPAWLAQLAHRPATLAEAATALFPVA
ncbi:phosphotransferase [Pilimelia terevasa]|uniref:Phosphotransferase n=1 Tax=Pilimelia terevasa TaxID=53372 RepID=A0A8J3BQY1_9ACTN|nr:aminoglycoside 3'-phosphotransferase/choline kinase family protein [Pilimelia terevasa]GGK43022.1 phosphotransferase [Pilimelia terevasa]